MAVAERLRKSSAERIVQVEGRQTRITASFGVASLALLEGEAATSEGLLKEADRYLYRAKKQGRNRVSGR